MKIAFVLYDQFTALDLAGPYEVIARRPGAEVHFVATGPDPVRADAGLVVRPTGTLDSLTAPIWW
jgi:putative intracellular protease/amidase